MKFTYHAKTKDGRLHSGIVEASSKEGALTLLQKHDLFVTFLEEAGKEPFYRKPIRFFERIKKKDVAIFSMQLAIMLGSKVPLSETLSVLAYQTGKQTFKEIILKVAEEVEGGTTLSKALSSYPKIFSPFYIAMIKSGEASGRLSGVIDDLSNYLEEEQGFYSKIRGVVTYPAFVFLFFLIIITFMIFSFIPHLSEILATIETEEELPLVTKFVLSLSDFLRSWGLILIVVFLVSIVGLIRYYKTKEGKKFFDRVLLKIPLIGDLLKKIHLSRLAENLSTLISGGIPISKALEITSEILENDVYKREILEVRDGVRRGEPMSVIFQRHPEIFPPLLVQMTLVGERAGKVDLTLKDTGKFYRKEVDSTLDILVSLLEPLMIVFLGVLVGGLVIAVLLPIYKMGI